MPTLLELESKIEIQPNGCWRWVGLLSPAGYGRLYFERKEYRAHKFFFLQSGGIIPEGYVLDHTCHTNSDCPGGVECPHRACVNPQHQEAVTSGENIRRGRTGQWKTRPECPSGHAYTEANTYRTPRGSKKCRKCRRESVRRAPSTLKSSWGFGANLAEA